MCTCTRFFCVETRGVTSFAGARARTYVQNRANFERPKIKHPTFYSKKGFYFIRNFQPAKITRYTVIPLHMCTYTSRDSPSQSTLSIRSVRTHQLSEQLISAANNWRADISDLLHFKHAFVRTWYLLMGSAIKFKFKTTPVQWQHCNC